MTVLEYRSYMLLIIAQSFAIRRRFNSCPNLLLWSSSRNSATFTACDELYQSYPALLLVATNTGVRRPGYEASNVSSNPNVNMKHILHASLYLWLSHPLLIQ